MNSINQNIMSKFEHFVDDLDPQKLNELPKERSLIVVPYVVKTGVVNSTEAGYVPGIGEDPNANVDNYSYFSQILTGREAVYVEWIGSTRVVDATNEPNFPKYDPYYRKCFKVGKYFRAWLISADTKIQIGSSTQNQDFVQEQIYRTYEVITDYAWQDNDDFLFYKIPQLAGEQWLMIDNVNQEQALGKVIRYKITFKSVNDTFAKSGLAIDQFVQVAKPGALSAQPKIVMDANKIPQIQLDMDYLDRTKTLPVTSAQLQFFGPAALSNIAMWARPIYKSDKLIYDAVTQEYKAIQRVGRLAFPFTFNASTPDQVSNNVIAEQNYYYLTGANLTIDTYWNNWQQKMAQATYDQLSKKKYEGHLVADHNSARDSNKLVNNVYSYTIQSDGSQFNTNTLAPHNLPELYVGGNRFCKGVYPDHSTWGIDVLNYLNVQTLNWVDYMIGNYFSASQTIQLPISVRQTTPWKVSDIPILGGLLGKIESMLGGLDLGWRNVKVSDYLAGGTFNVLASAELCEWESANYDVNVSPTMQDFLLPIDMFRANSDDEIGGIIGASSTASVFNFDISDMFVDTNGSISSLFFGQEDNLGTQQFYNVDKTISYMGLGRPEMIGYEVDLVHFQALAKSNFKLTFYNGVGQVDYDTSDPTPIWTGTYQTIAMYSSNTRNWTNQIKLGNDNFEGKNNLTWPVDINGYVPNQTPTYTLGEYIQVTKQAIDNHGSVDQETYPDAIVGQLMDIISISPSKTQWTKARVNYTYNDQSNWFTINKADLLDFDKLSFSSTIDSDFDIYQQPLPAQVISKSNNATITINDDKGNTYACQTSVGISDGNCIPYIDYYRYNIGCYTKNSDTSIIYLFMYAVAGSCNGLLNNRDIIAYQNYDSPDQIHPDSNYIVIPNQRPNPVIKLINVQFLP